LFHTAMQVFETRQNIPRRSLFFFLLGSGSYVFMLRAYVWWAYAPPADRTFVDHPLVNAGLAVLGGISAAVISSLLKRGLAKPTDLQIVRTLLAGGAYGTIAIGLCLQVIYVFAGFYLTFRAEAVAPGGLLSAFKLAMLGIETYGLVVTIQWLPFGLIQGSVIAACVLWTGRGSRGESASASKKMTGA